MSQDPNKTPASTQTTPATGAELAWIAVLLALCVMANNWLVGQAPEPAPAKPIVAQAKATPPIAAPERPSRDRPNVDRERPWRDPNSSALPGL
jgi:hypothetical protein